MSFLFYSLDGMLEAQRNLDGAKMFAGNLGQLTINISAIETNGIMPGIGYKEKEGNPYEQERLPIVEIRKDELVRQKRDEKRRKKIKRYAKDKQNMA